jgi:hypothetical protein
MKKQTNSNEMTAADFRNQYVDQQEHGLQKRCVDWFRKQFKMILIFAVPNAAKRSWQLANMLRAEGMVSGIPDLIVAYPSKGFHGLYIEMKTVKGKPSDEQITVQAYLRANGYQVIQPRTFEEFQQGVNEYLL